MHAAHALLILSLFLLLCLGGLHALGRPDVLLFSGCCSSCCAALLCGPGAPRAPCVTCSTTSCSNNAFTFGPELSSLITPLASQTHSLVAVAAAYYLSQQQGLAGLVPPPVQPPAASTPPSPPFGFQLPHHLSELPMFNAPPSPPDSLSDCDSYLSGSLSSSNLSGSKSPSLDPGHHLPIFSCLSISED